MLLNMYFKIDLFNVPEKRSPFPPFPKPRLRKKALKKGEPKGGVKNFTHDDWKEECAEWSEAEWRAFRLKEDRERGPVHEVKGAARTAVKFSRAAALLAF